MYKSAKVTEHAFKTLSKAIQAGSLPSLMLLCGPEALLIDWACGALKNALVNPAAEVIDCAYFAEGDFGAGDVIAASETLPLMSARRLVFVKKDPAELPELADYFRDIPETTLLCFTVEKPDKRKACYKAIEKLGIIYEFTALDESTLAGWAGKRLSAAGKRASSYDLIRFASDAGYFDTERSYGLYNLQNDLIKAANLYEGPQLSYEDLLAVSSGESESAAFKLLDCAFAGRKGEALQLLNNSIKAEMPSKQMGAVLRFHGLLCSQLEIMLEARERSEDGQSKNQIKEETGINGYRLDRAVAAAERLSTDRLKAALAGAYKIEQDVKNGRLDGKLAMELFIAKL